MREILIGVALLAGGSAFADGAFTETGDLELPREGVRVVALPSARGIDQGVLAIGGQNMEGPLATIEQWTDSSGNGGRWDFAGRMRVARVGHTVTRIADDCRVLIVGGGGRLAEIWGDADCEEGRVRDAGRLSVSRRFHTATLLQDGRVLVIGGRDPADRPLATAEIWTPRDGKWHSVGRLAQARCCHTATLLDDGRVLVVGGRVISECMDREEKPPCYDVSDSVEIWDPKTSRFSVATRLPGDESRAGHTATRLGDGRVLVVGGADGTGEQRFRALLWDPKTTGWTKTDGTGRQYHTATLLRDGRVLIYGGSHWFCACCKTLPGQGEGGKYLDDARIYDPQTGIWSDAGRAKQSRAEHDAALLPDGRVLIVGGGASEFVRTFPSHQAEIWAPSEPVR